MPPRGVATPLDTIVGREDVVGDAPVTSLRARSPRRAVDRHDGRRAQGADARRPRRVDSGAAGRPSLARRRRRAGDCSSRAAARSGSARTAAAPTCSIPRRARFASFRSAPHPGAVSAPIVTAIAEDRAAAISGSARTAADSISRAPTAPCCNVFRNDPANPSTLPANTVYALAVDGNGRVWIATDGGGLARVVDPRQRPSAMEFQVLSRADGLRATPLYGIVPDAARPALAQRQRRAHAPRSRDAAPSRRITASTACKAKSSRSAPTFASATAASPSADRAASTSSIPRRCRRTRSRRASR